MSDRVDAAVAALQERPYLLGALRAVKGCSRPIAETLVQLIAFDERPFLESLGIVTPGPGIGKGYHSLEVTEFGWAVIEACPDLDHRPIYPLADGE